jgi:hypothetical protein
MGRLTWEQRNFHHSQLKISTTESWNENAEPFLTIDRKYGSDGVTFEIVGMQNAELNYPDAKVLISKLNDFVNNPIETETS